MDPTEAGPETEGFEISPDTRKMYMNVFGVAMGRSDIVLVARHNESELAAISMSYTTAKSLAQSLGEVVAYLEAKTGNTIMTIEEIERKLSQAPDEEGES